MKKLIPLLLVITLICSLYACKRDRKNYVYFPNKQQDEYAIMLADNEGLVNSAGNEIVAKEAQEVFDKKLSNFVERTRIFINWQGYINNIRTVEHTIEGKKYTKLSFKIDVKLNLQELIEPTFECSALIPADSLNTDFLYNKIKGLSDKAPIYFDGVIKRNGNEIAYNPAFSKKHIYPRYYFEVIDIGIAARKDTLPQSLRNLIDIDYAILDSVKANWKKDRNLMPKLVSKHKSEIDSLLNILSPEERAYRNRLFNFNIEQWMREVPVW